MTHKTDQFLAWLTTSMSRLHQAVSRAWNRQAPTPRPGQPEPYTDQW
ncbi:MAG: hypothetical protein OXP66_11340 [Candidatus Tectomicrobia bacterium]|nr:hypothetical protein [Candidatus Tectomicrobia bacterium]